MDIAGATNAVVLFGHAEPIGEPVVAHGPFVMNTRQEILDAIATTRPASSTLSAPSRKPQSTS